MVGVATGKQWTHSHVVYTERERERERECHVAGQWGSCYTIMSLPAAEVAPDCPIVWGTTSRRDTFTSLRNTERFLVNLEGRKMGELAPQQ